MLKDLQLVALTRDLPDAGLRRGAVGTIVHVYPAGAAYEVEFDRIAGASVPIVTLEPGDIRPATEREVGRLRQNAGAPGE
jgi:hypothetical protein